MTFRCSIDIPLKGRTIEQLKADLAKLKSDHPHVGAYRVGSAKNADGTCTVRFVSADKAVLTKLLLP